MMVPLAPLNTAMDNVTADGLGAIARRASVAEAGDDIDRGLRLVRMLREAGFVVARDPQAPRPPRGAWTWPTDGRTPTDKELAEVLPTLSLEHRIETILRKFVGGTVSTYYNGETSASFADAKIAKRLMVKLRPWLPREP